MQQITMEEMSSALGLSRQPRTERSLPHRAPRIFVRLSVRNGGGLPICYKKTVSGISKLQAEIEVKKMAAMRGIRCGPPWR